MKDAHEKELKSLRQDHEQQVKKLRNSISSLQNELNMECNFAVTESGWQDIAMAFGENSVALLKKESFGE